MVKAALSVAGIFAEKVLMSKNKGDKLRKRCATGIAALTTTSIPNGRQWRIVFKARYIISSAGSLHTPALLLRSKISVNGNVGKNLRLHPATAIIGVFSNVRCRGPTKHWH
jgi:hypothetical protein